jgi:hypothetical protein
MDQLTSINSQQQSLLSIDEIRAFFKSNTTPIYLVGPTCFHLIGVEQWIPKLNFISHIDSFDGQCKHIFTPKETIRHEEFKSVVDVNNYLLSHPEVIDFINNNGKPGDNGRVLFLKFNRQTEILAKKLHLKCCFPDSKTRNYLDNKLNTSAIAERADVPCVPNILAKVNSYAHLKPISSSLGTDLAIQTPFENYGDNTFFISKEEDYFKYANTIEKERVVKIMKRHRNYKRAGIEACVTSQGTIVAPLMTDIVGIEELTPYESGWCGNEIYANAFSDTIRKKARIYTQKFGKQLFKEGFRGYFELDFLIENDEKKIYLYQLLPKISGISNLYNHAQFSKIEVPLFLFHMLEWMDIPFKIDIDALNNIWEKYNYNDEWSLLLIKHTLKTNEQVTDTPASGIWKMKADGNISYKDFSTDQNAIEGKNEAFFFNIIRIGDYMFEGLNLGIIILRDRLMMDDFKLNQHSKKWINAFIAQYRSEIVETISKPYSIRNHKKLNHYSL